jgi:hypothetical protein
MQAVDPEWVRDLPFYKKPAFWSVVGPLFVYLPITLGYGFTWGASSNGLYVAVVGAGPMAAEVAMLAAMLASFCLVSCVVIFEISRVKYGATGASALCGLAAVALAVYFTVAYTGAQFADGAVDRTVAYLYAHTTTEHASDEHVRWFEENMLGGLVSDFKREWVVAQARRFVEYRTVRYRFIYCVPVPIWFALHIGVLVLTWTKCLKESEWSTE